MGDAPLTRRQESLLAYLRAREGRGEPAPSLDQICEALALRSRGSLHKQVRALVEAGLVEDMAGRQRGVRLRRALEPAASTRPAHTLPLLGRIAAGEPLEALAVGEEIEVPAALCSERPCYVLRVKGDSMIEEGILDGDLVVIEDRSTARNGEIVVALVDGEEATLKRIVQKPREVWLWPANRAMEPVKYAPERVRIQGVVVGQMRSYR
jgi:repressor LexA